MRGRIIYGSTEVFYEVDKKDKQGNPVTQRKEIISAGIVSVKKLIQYNEDGDIPSTMLEAKFRCVDGKYHVSRLKLSDLSDWKRLQDAIDCDSIVVNATKDELDCFRLDMRAQSFYYDVVQMPYSGVFEKDGRLVYMDRKGYVTAEAKSWNKSVMSDIRAPYRDLTGIADVSEETLTEAVSRLHAYGPLDRCTAVIGFAQAAALSWHLYKIKYELPILYLTGETSAGKTATMTNILQPLTGCEGKKPLMADSMTTFPLVERASRSNIVPLVIDEYKISTFSNKNKNSLSNFLRNAYSNGQLLRGTKDLDVKEYAMHRPLVLAGETGLEEPALQNRTVTCGFYGTDITPERRDSFEWLSSHEDALRAISWKMLRYALSLTLEDVSEAINKAMTYVPDTFRQIRIQKSFAVIFAGYMLFSEKFGARADIADAATALANSMYEHVMGSSSTPETEAIQFLRTLAEMTEVNADASYYLSCNRNYSYDEEKDAIWLNLNKVYPLYYNYCYRVGKTAVPKTDLDKQLKHNPKVMASESKVFHVRNAGPERRKMFYLEAIPTESAELFRQQYWSIHPTKAVRADQPSQPDSGQSTCSHVS